MEPDGAGTGQVRPTFHAGLRWTDRHIKGPSLTAAFGWKEAGSVPAPISHPSSPVRVSLPHTSRDIIKNIHFCPWEKHLRSWTPQASCPVYHLAFKVLPVLHFCSLISLRPYSYHRTALPLIWSSYQSLTQKPEGRGSLQFWERCYFNVYETVDNNLKPTSSLVDADLTATHTPHLLAHTGMRFMILKTWSFLSIALYSHHLGKM